MAAWDHAYIIYILLYIINYIYIYARFFDGHISFHHFFHSSVGMTLDHLDLDVLQMDTTLQEEEMIIQFTRVEATEIWGVIGTMS